MSLELMTKMLRAVSSGACLATLAAVLAALSVSAHATLPIQSWQLANGARVLFVENRALPMIDVSVDFPAGYVRDTEAKSGLAGMTLGMMRLGAGELNENDLAARLADVGAQLTTRFDADRAGYQLRALSMPDEREPALAVIAAVLQAPAFPAAAFARERDRLVAALKEAQTKPETIAERAFARAVFRGHPYGFNASGEIDTVVGLTVEDVVAFYRAHYRSDHATVAIIGDLSRDEANAIAQRLTDRLPRAGHGVIPVEPVTPLARSKSIRIDHPASQSHIRVGAVGMRRDDPDYFALFVGNYVLGGGGFASRLVEEVRQKRGLAYSSYSHFQPFQEAGPFVLGLQTRKDQADEALAVVQDTLRRYVVEGPTEQELAAAKQNLIGGFPLRIDTSRKLHDYLGIIGFYGLPLDYLDRFVQQVDAVSVAQVRDAFRRRVDPERLVTVVVGAAKAP
jgi:zinc protease